MNPAFLRYGLILMLCAGFIRMEAQQDSIRLSGRIDTVLCQADPGQRYALYVPSAYDPAEKWPVIYVLEPGARAILGRSVFEEAAERYGYLVACTYNAQNGPMEPVRIALEAMRADLSDRLWIDPDRIYLAGFSGGARAACKLGMENPEIAGVIGCGAGFLESDPPSPAVRFDYVALVGNQDMNYLELNRLQTLLDAHGIHHTLSVFEGGHDWPPAFEIDRACSWLEIRAMQKGLKEKDKALLTKILASGEEEVSEYVGAGLDYEAFLRICELEKWFAGEETPGIKHKKFALEGRESVQNGIRLSKEIFETEEGLWNMYLDEVAKISLMAGSADSLLKSESWWKKEMKKLDKYEANEARSWQLMGLRMKDYLIRASWTEYYNSFGLDNLNAAKRFVEIWQLADPDSPAPSYAMARIHARAGKSSWALKDLEQAVEMGFSRKDLMEAEELFDTFRDSKKFREIMDGMKDVMK